MVLTGMNDKSKEPGKGERIAKRMAAAGICSRRDAERLIEEGVVKLNGVKVTTPATLVTDVDQITVRGKGIAAPSRLRVFLFHKPVGLVTTTRDEQGRPTVFEGLPPELPRLISVGRLDLNSEGLLIMTTSGEFSRYLELPVRGFERTYRVRIFGHLSERDVERLARGVKVEGVKYGPVIVVPEKGKEKPDSSNAWVYVTLTEGKNREIRKVFDYVGVQVNRLIRVSYGPFELGTLPKGALTEVSTTFLKKNFPTFYHEQKK